MKKYLLTTTAVVAVAALAVPATADTMYLTGFGGLNLLDDESVDIRFTSYLTHYGPYSETVGPSTFVVTHTTKGLLASIDGDYEFETGFVIGAAAGREYSAMPGLSVEGEIAFRKNDLDLDGAIQVGYYVRKYATKFTKTSSATKAQYNLTKTKFYTAPYSSSVGGDLTAFSIMANVWYEFPSTGQLHPFIGGGIGWAKVELDLDEPADSSGDDTGFAWQIGAGVSYDMSDRTSIRFEYRRFQVNDIEIRHDDMTDLGISDYEANDIIVGVRVRF